MKVHQNIYKNSTWQQSLESMPECQLILLFGDRELARDSVLRADITHSYPNAEIIGCTTAGEILGVDIYDETLCLTAIEFDRSRIRVAHGSINNTSIEELSRKLCHELTDSDLKYVMVLSDGQKINGTQLATSLERALPPGVLITGGLAGDGTRFGETIVWHNDKAESGMLVLCGFYGDDITITHGTMGGWDAFGPERIVTKSKDNVLWTLDDKPALELYKKYLGEYANELPSSALRFPLLIKKPNEDVSVIRTILNVDDSDQSMIFAGDIPEGARASLMHANFDRLIGGAELAAEKANTNTYQPIDDCLVLMISCVGRRLILNQRTEEEVEAVGDVFGEGCFYAGFYSYGEISPIIGDEYCILHNQTMTITGIFEREK